MNELTYKIMMRSPKSIQDKLLYRAIKAEGGKMFSKTIRRFYKEKYNIEIGYGSYGGCFSQKNIPPGTTFGNYCSIAGEIRIFRANHPAHLFTSHPILYNPAVGFVEKDLLDRPSINIGHDVWIGEWAIVCPKVRLIGNGSMIGAGTVVTKDVPPYSIVVGNPGRVIKQRFDEKTIESLEKSKWWELEKNELFARKDEFQKLLFQ